MTDRAGAASTYPVRMWARIDRLARPPSGLAALALGLGVVNIVSALTPELTERVRVVQTVLSPDAEVAARGLTLAAGVAMLFVASSLARRKHRAWLLAVVVVAASAVLHIAKGLDLEESIANVALLVRRARRSRLVAAVGGGQCPAGVAGGGGAAGAVWAWHGRDQDPARGRAGADGDDGDLARAPVAAALAGAGCAERGRPSPGAPDRARVGRRQPFLLRAAARPPLRLLAARRRTARLPRRGRLRARVGRPGREPGVDPRHGARVRVTRTPARLAAGCAALLRGMGRPVPGDRHAGAADRRRGGAVPTH